MRSSTPSGMLIFPEVRSYFLPIVLLAGGLFPWIVRSSVQTRVTSLFCVCACVCAHVLQIFPQVFHFFPLYIFIHCRTFKTFYVVIFISSSRMTSEFMKYSSLTFFISHDFLYFKGYLIPFMFQFFSPSAICFGIKSEIRIQLFPHPPLSSCPRTVY